MKKIYTIILFLAAAIPAMAQQMIVEKGNISETIEFSDFEKITFNDVTVNITKTDGITLSAAMSEISRIHFGDYSNIDNLEFEAEKLIAYISNDAIAVNCNAGITIAVYDITGTEVICARQKADNGAVNIAQLPKGIYIIKVDDRTAKFVKR